ncbi:MAG: pseudouridine synthase [Thiotrichales bacterium]|nr:pseudouridine synthase [Thiotrichales bacterium]
MRINKYLSQVGVCSKRAADRLILAGQVLVNDQLAQVGQLVSEQDQIRVNGQLIGGKPKPIYLVYHKPVGVVCTNDPSVAGNLVAALAYPERVFAVGRLDKASEGLLLLTNDGAIFNQILRAENAHQKTYLVTVNKPITQAFLTQMAKGVPILDTVTLPCQVTQVDELTFKIVLTQGLNLQIRRMCLALGFRVHRLQRTQIMNLSLDGLGPNEYRALSLQETTHLMRLLSDSKS